jgi:hypothetical protein
MGIREISGEVPLQQSTKEKKIKEATTPARSSSDRVEVSAEARSLFEAGQRKRLEEIQRRVHDKFYFQREVTEQFVDTLLSDLLK